MEATFSAQLFLSSQVKELDFEISTENSLKRLTNHSVSNFVSFGVQIKRKILYILRF